jgi:hypothetical protein
MEKAKKITKEFKKTTPVVLKNLTEIVEATSLAIVAGYAIWSAIYQHNLERIEDHVLLTAGSVVSLIAFTLYVKHLRKK